MVTMNASRVIRHLCTTHWALGRAFGRATLVEIETAIAACNAEHVGEVRFAVESALHGDALFRGQSSRERALEVFSQLRIWDTEHNNGVLIYMLLADRAVEIVADRGVHAKVGTQEWQAICRTMEAAFGRRAYREGALSGIRAVARHLRSHYPATKASGDPPPAAPVLL